MKQMNINLPCEVKYIIQMLETSGHKAYAVGGCVRDSVLGKEPKDWDICTSALPEETKKCFEKSSGRIFETGLHHGTVSLLQNGKTFEITTFRTDGTYSDNRRPDTVNFIKDLKSDLSRRDFTINALAYHPKEGLIDYFGGTEDIKSKQIRCVGDADARFREDALRIMRALRFSSVLGFEIEKNTLEALVRNRKLLENIAAERIHVELDGLLVGKNVKNVLTLHYKVIEIIIPEIAALVGFDQKSRYHDLDVWSHTVKAVANVEGARDNRILKLTMLLHDIAKPECYTEKEGAGHFYGHPQAGSEVARKILNRLKYDKKTIKTITKLVQYHDTEIKPSAKAVRRWLNKLGIEQMQMLISVKAADASAKSSERLMTQVKEIEEITRILDEVIKSGSCFSLKDLSVNGKDMIDCGISEGAEVGKALQQLLELVIDEKLPNEREALLHHVHTFSTVCTQFKHTTDKNQQKQRTLINPHESCSQIRHKSSKMQEKL